LTKIINKLYYEIRHPPNLGAGVSFFRLGESMTAAASPNTSTLQQLKELIQSGVTIDEKTRDILLFSAIIDIYGLLTTNADETRKKFSAVNAILEPVARVYKVGAWAAGIGGSIVIGLLMTGRVEITIK